MPDHNYILKTESDLMMDALQRQLMVEFESQKKAQADSFVAELADNVRHFDDECEQRLEGASKAWSEEKSQLLSRLEIAQAAQERLEGRVLQLEAVIQDWADEEGDNWWTDDRTGSDKEGPGGLRSGNRMYDPTVSGTTHHELDRDDGYSYVGSDAAGDVTAVATSVASKTITF